MAALADRRPYHELEAAVARMEAELSAFAPMAQAMLRMEQRAADAEQRSRDFEREVREAGRRVAAAEKERDDLRADGGFLRDIYRRGYRAGYDARKRGRDADPERSLRDRRVQRTLGLVA